MAVHGYLSHAGRDGSTAGDRIAAAGFEWQAAGENIASGQASARAVVRAWLASPEHCANLMNPAFTATAAAYAVDPRAAGGIYWTQDLARPLDEGRR